MCPIESASRLENRSGAIRADSSRAPSRPSRARPAARDRPRARRAARPRRRRRAACGSRRRPASPTSRIHACPGTATGTRRQRGYHLAPAHQCCGQPWRASTGGASGGPAAATCTRTPVGEIVEAVLDAVELGHGRRHERHTLRGRMRRSPLVLLVVAVLATPAAARTHAPGAPGASRPGRTPTSRPFGTSATRESRVWFTLRDREMTEVYFPDLGTPALRSTSSSRSRGPGTRWRSIARRYTPSAWSSGSTDSTSARP